MKLCNIYTYIYIYIYIHIYIYIQLYIYIQAHLECRVDSWLEMMLPMAWWYLAIAPFPLGHHLGGSWNQQPRNRKNRGSPSTDSGMNHDKDGCRICYCYLWRMNYNIFRDVLGRKIRKGSEHQGPWQTTSNRLYNQRVALLDSRGSTRTEESLR